MTIYEQSRARLRGPDYARIHAQAVEIVGTMDARAQLLKIAANFMLTAGYTNDGTQDPIIVLEGLDLDARKEALVGVPLSHIIAGLWLFGYTVNPDNPNEFLTQAMSENFRTFSIFMMPGYLGWEKAVADARSEKVKIALRTVKYEQLIKYVVSGLAWALRTPVDANVPACLGIHGSIANEQHHV